MTVKEQSTYRYMKSKAKIIWGIQTSRLLLSYYRSHGTVVCFSLGLIIIIVDNATPRQKKLWPLYTG